MVLERDPSIDELDAVTQGGRQQEAPHIKGEDADLEDVKTLLGLLESRSATYALLARLYRKEVDQALLDEMFAMLYPVATGDENVDEGNHLIAVYLSNLWTDSLDELAVDFAYCFLGHGVDAYSGAFPFESVYTSEKRLLMQDARDEVLDTYRAFGMKKSEEWNEGEDHIALELEFMQVLNDRAVEALSEGDQDKAYELLVGQRSFLANHLCAWVPMMTADLKKFAKTKMYQGLAYLTDGFLETDYVFLKDLLAERT